MLSPHRLLIYVSRRAVIGFELFSFNEALQKKIYYTGGKKSAEEQYVKPTTVCFTYNYLLLQPVLWAWLLCDSSLYGIATWFTADDLASYKNNLLYDVPHAL